MPELGIDPNKPRTGPGSGIGWSPYPNQPSTGDGSGSGSGSLG